MVKKGFARPIKKVAGALVGIGGGMLLFMPDKLMQYKTVFGVVCLAAAYFLVISGRRL